MNTKIINVTVAKFIYPVPSLNLLYREII